MLLVERGLASTRSQAQALLIGGRVFSGERRVEKAGTLIDAETPLSVRAGPRFVSRGGGKLDAALDALRLDVSDVSAADLGASTGGFTDCLLQRGAARVVAIDVGHGQLAPSLRADPRVVVMERTNARHLTRGDLPWPVTLVVVDASFISLEVLLPAIAGLLDPGGRLLALVKPQFEAGRDEARRSRGVIRDPEVRAAAIERIRAAMAAHGFTVETGCDSAIKGPKGNVEHFLLATRVG